MGDELLYVSFNTRPIRLAFLVEQPDPSVLQEVFQLNTLLWGGLLNPVLVLDGSSRQQIGSHYQFIKTTYEEEILGTLKEFDPDILINFSDVTLPAYLHPFSGRIYKRDALRWNPWGQEEISFFLEVWPFLNRYWRKEFRFLQNPPHKYGYIELSDAGAFKPYLAARFGSYPEGNDGNLVLANHFGGKPVSYDQSFRKLFNSDEWIFPMRITTLELDIPSPNRSDSHLFFLFDPTNMFDVVDYWNLRAAGFYVFPLPVDDYEDFASSAKAFADHAVYHLHGVATRGPEVVKSRSLEDLQLNESGDWLRSLGLDATDLSLRGWVPRFLGSGHSASSEVWIRPAVSKENNEIINLDDSYGTVRGPIPECEMVGPAFSQHWATELQASDSGSEERTFRIPWLHPECDSLANWRVGRGHGPASSRVSKQGIVTIRSGDREHIRIEEPKVTEVLRAFLKDAGYTYSGTSSPGLALERIVEQFGGLLACSVIQNSAVREIIEELANGPPMHAQDVRSRIHKSLLLPKDERDKKIAAVLETLVSKKVLRQGLWLQCEKCQRHDWYHLSELGEEFKCKRCFNVQLVPMLEKSPWYYVSDGIFRLEGKVAGCFTGILSLIFLRLFLSPTMKYVSSFEYKDAAGSAERDYAVLTCEFMADDVDVIIGECKTSKELKPKEKNDSKLLGRSTGAYLAFSTLSRDFSDADKQFFTELIDGGQKLILLTAKHLGMSTAEISQYHIRNRVMCRDVELLSRLTTIDLLGKPFADKHHIWV